MVLCRTKVMEAINNEALIAGALWQATRKKHMTRIVIPNAAVTGKCSKVDTGVIQEQFQSRSGSDFVITIASIAQSA